MKVLIVHNYYGSTAPSGENKVFEAEMAMLKRYGHEVKTFIRRSDEIRDKGVLGLIRGAISVPWNFFTTIQIKRILKSFKPDVVHVHNTFPLISPSVFYALEQKAASVITLHNYRIFCPAALPFRNGKICLECIESKNIVPALVHSCYRQSLAATIPLAVNVSLHRILGTWTKKIDAFIVLSEFQKELIFKAGIPDSILHLKPNFHPIDPPVIPWSKKGRHIIFVGRLTVEKGILTLLNAWKLWGKDAPDLHIIGDGELRFELENMAKGLPIKFFGQLESTITHSKIAESQLLILPSECFEGSPMAVIEAFAFGTPAAVSDIGPLPSIVKHGKCGPVFKFSNPQSIVSVLSDIWNDSDLLESCGINAREEFNLNYTEKGNYKSLLDIYEKAILSNVKKKLKLKQK